jgi:hypothetical protein
VLVENIVDFWIMVMGMIYISIVYKVYKKDTFLSRPLPQDEARIFFSNWYTSTNTINDYWFLLIKNFTHILNAILQLRLISVLRPMFDLFILLLRELLILEYSFFCKHLYSQW